VIGAPQLLAGLLLVSLQQSPPPVHEPEAPAAALAPGGADLPPSSTGEHPSQAPPGLETGGAPVEVTPPDTPPPGSPPPAPAPTTPRISFSLPFPQEKGGGEATGTAGALDYQREDFAVLTGGVRMHYKDMDLAAEVISVDLGTKDLTAVGNVVIDQGPSRLTGGSSTYNLDTKLGTFKDASGAAQPGIYFSGDRIDKVGEDEYVITHGIFTSCQGEVPAWSFHVSSARVRLEDYAHVKNATMRAKALPVLYVPYVVWPTRTDRASGLLVPKLGNSAQKGAYLGLAYFKTLGRSWDTTLYTDLYSKDYFGVGNEIRYRPTDQTSGAFRAYAIDDPTRDKYRWKVRWDHDTRDLPFGLRGVVQYEDYSDFDYFRDFERGLSTKTKNQIYSDAYVTGNWGNQSVNMLIDRRRTFLSEQDIIALRQLPEIEYKLRPLRLGHTPLYLSWDSAAHYLQVDRGLVQSTYPRFHFQPTLRVPLAPVPWLSLTVSGGGNLTWYGDSVNTHAPPGTNTFCSDSHGQCDSSLTRTLPFAGAELIGPSFSHIFNASVGPFGKLKHIIEPRFSWAYIDAFDKQNEVPIFDEIDPLSPLGSNVGRVALINRVLAKPTDAKNGSAREVFSLELSRSYSFDDQQPLEQGLGQHSQLGPLRASLRSYPTPSFGLRVDADYSMLFGQLTGVQASGDFAIGRQHLSFTWTPRWQPTTGKELTDQGTFGATLNPFKSGRLSLSSYLTYDFQESFVRDQRHLFTYTGSCYALHLELHQSLINDVRRRDYIFSVDLKNVGTFIDLNGGESQGL
jgi:LPS-assembly protein